MFCTYNGFKYSDLQYNYCGPDLRAVFVDTASIGESLEFFISLYIEDLMDLEDDVSVAFITTLQDDLTLSALCYVTLAVLHDETLTINDVCSNLFSFMLDENIGMDDKLFKLYQQSLGESLDIDSICSFFMEQYLFESIDIEVDTFVAEVLIEIIRDYFVLDLTDDDCRSYFSMQLFKSIFDYAMK